MGTSPSPVRVLESVIEEGTPQQKSKGWSVFRLHGLWAAHLGTAPVGVPAMLPYDFRSLKIG